MNYYSNGYSTTKIVEQGKINKLWFLLLIFLFVSCNNTPKKQEFLNQKKVKINWEEVASSQIIVEGTLTIPLQKIEKIERTKEYDYVTITLNDVTYLKGFKSNQNSLEVKLYLKDNSEILKRLNGKRVVAYLKIIDDSKKQDSLFLVNGSKSIVNILNIDKIKKEIIEQKNCLKKDLMKIYSNTNRYNKVKLLIEQMLNKETATQAYRALEKLESKATPYIILQMDDHRDLAIKTISLENRNKNVFEEVAHYSPEKVIDVLSLILSRREGKYFTPELANGGSAIQRKNEIKAWLIWLCKIR